jgi:putative transposase
VDRRKVTYRLYPRRSQAEALERHRVLHQRLYNALLEQRIMAHRQHKRTLTFAEQCREITKLRAEMPEYAELSVQSLQVTAKRVDLAFKAFFRRVREKKGKAGFPRFKAIARFSGWGHKGDGDGWRFTPGERGKHGWLRLKGVGRVRTRGQARFDGEPKTCEVMLKQGRWYVSVTVEASPKRDRGGAAVGLDWGVETFATLAHEDGTTERIENPAFLRQDEGRILRAQRAVSRKKRGSRNRDKARQRLARLHERVANRRQNFLHQESAKLIERCRAIVTEELAVKAMTSSARGTLEQPGKNVRQKAGLNRSILDTSPAAFLQMLRYKAEEAGVAYLEVSPRRWAPSQTCHACGRRAKKALSVREHRCECGAACSRDENAARVLIGLLGREPALCGGASLDSPLKQETPSVATFAQVE